MTAGDDRIFRERTEVLLGIRKPNDPNRAVRVKDLTSTNSKLFATVAKGAIEAAIQSSGFDAGTLLQDIQDALTAKDEAIENAQTASEAAISSANTVAGNLSALIGNFVGDLPSLKATQDGLGSNLSSLTTRVSTAETGLTNETSARTSADTSLTNSLNAAVSRIGDSEAAIATETTTRANADTAITATTNTLTTNVGTQTGRIDDIRALKASALTGTSLGTFLTQLQVNSGGTSALVSAQGSAISNLQGTVDALYKIEVKSGTGGAILQLIAPGGGPSVAQLDADFINLIGKVSAESLLIGLGGNMIANSQFKQGLIGFTVATSGIGGGVTTMTLRTPPSAYAGKSYPTLMLYQPSSSSDGYAEIKNVQVEANRNADNRAIPVKPGAYYEMSAGISMHRCTGNLFILWRDADGVFISGPSVALPSQVGPAGSDANPDLWPRYTVIAQAPAGAAFAQMVARKNATTAGQADSYLFLTKPMFAETHAFATKSRPYSAGGATLIDGDGIASSSVTADKMVVGTITAASGIIANATIGSAQIINAAITNAKIGNAAVDTLTIAGNAVTVPVYATAPDVNLPNEVTGTIVSLNIARGAGFRTEVQFTCDFQVPVQGNTNGYARIELYRSGVLIETVILDVGNSSQSGASLNLGPLNFNTVDTDTSGGTVNYQIKAGRYNAGLWTFGFNNIDLRANQFKR